MSCAGARCASCAGTSTLVAELLASAPSIVFGIWGVFALAPFLRQRRAEEVVFITEARIIKHHHEAQLPAAPVWRTRTRELWAKPPQNRSTNGAVACRLATPVASAFQAPSWGCFVIVNDKVATRYVVELEATTASAGNPRDPARNMRIPSRRRSDRST